MNNEIRKFEVGKTYEFHSILDSDYTWTAKVIKRTKKTITIDIDTEGIKTVKINSTLSEMNGCESVRPLGRFSMSPILDAKEIKRVA